MRIKIIDLIKLYKETTSQDQKKLAKRFSTTQQSISRWQLGKTLPQRRIIEFLFNWYLNKNAMEYRFKNFIGIDEMAEIIKIIKYQLRPGIISKQSYDDNPELQDYFEPNN